MPEKVTVQFTDRAEVEAGSIAVIEMQELLKESKHGEITLVIKDGRVIESHRKVCKHYGGRGST